MLHCRRCVTAAAPGCTALLHRHKQLQQVPGSAADSAVGNSMLQLSEQAAVGLVRQFVGVHVQGLDFKGRSACYQLLLEVLEVFMTGLIRCCCCCCCFRRCHQSQ
jgi:hypothetical protein